MKTNILLCIFLIFFSGCSKDLFSSPKYPGKLTKKIKNVEEMRKVINEHIPFESFIEAAQKFLFEEEFSCNIRHNNSQNFLT